MKILLLSVVLALLCSLVAGQLGGHCEAFAGEPAACSFINYLVWIKPNTTQAELASNISRTSTLLALAPAACQPFAKASLCGSAFPPCFSNSTIGYPQLTCRSVCEGLTTECPKVPGQPAVDCENDITDLYPEADAIPKWPNSTFEYNNTTIECSVIIPPNTQLNVTCNKPLLFDNRTGAGTCAIPCPIPLYSKSADIIETWIIWIFSPLSLLLSTILMATWFVDSEKRKFEPLYYLFASTTVCIGFILTFRSEPGEHVCKNKIESVGHNDFFCAIQAATTQFACVAGITWWALIIFGLFNVVTRDRFQIFGLDKLIPIPFAIIQHIVGWGVASVFLIVGFANKAWGPTGIVCIFSGKWGWITMWGPFCFFWIIGVLMLSFVFAKIYSVAGYKGLRKQGRTLIFCGYLMLMGGYQIAFQGYVQYIRPRTEEAVEDWLACLLQPGGSQQRCHIHTKPNIVTNIIAVWLGLITPTAIFINFFSWKEFVRIWRKVFTGNDIQASRSYTTEEMGFPKKVISSGGLSSTELELREESEKESEREKGRKDQPQTSNNEGNENRESLLGRSQDSSSASSSSRPPRSRDPSFSASSASSRSSASSSSQSRPQLMRSAATVPPYQKESSDDSSSGSTASSSSRR